MAQCIHHLEDNETIEDMNITITKLNDKIQELEDKVNKIKSFINKIIKQHIGAINKLSLAVYSINEILLNQIFNKQEQEENANENINENKENANKNKSITLQIFIFTNIMRLNKHKRGILINFWKFPTFRNLKISFYFLRTRFHLSIQDFH